MKDTYQQLELEQDPQVKMELMLQLSMGLLNSDLARCEELALELLALGQQYDISAAVMHHHLLMGRTRYRQGLIPEALQYFTQAEAIAQNINHLRGKGSCLEMYGVIADRQGRHSEALDLFMQSLAVFKEINAPDNVIGLAYNNIANAYTYLLQSDKAEEYYQLAIETLQKTDREHTITLIKSNLGILRYQKGHFAEAIAYFEAGLVGFIKRKNIQAQSQAYSHIGHSYLALKEYSKALIYFQKGLKLIRSTNLDNELSSIYWGLGELYTALDGYKDALRYLTKALEIRLDKSYWAEACETYYSFHRLYMLMGDTAQANQALADGKKLSLEQGLKHWEEKFVLG